jgi:hypothetical protein
MQYFDVDIFNIQYWDFKDLKKRYRNFALAIHPDRGGDTEQFKILQAEWEDILKMIDVRESKKYSHGEKKPPDAFDLAKELGLSKMLDKLLKFPQITIEICGVWLWISGRTWTIPQELASLGCYFSKSKKVWYWTNGLIKRWKHGARFSSLKKVRETYGSIKVKDASNEPEMLTASR